MNRPAVPRNIERMLWAESIGHCMNPSCPKELMTEGSSIGDMAHIKPHEVDGATSFDNLILLCKNCHKKIDDSRDTKDTEKVLTQWKSNRQNEIRQIYQKKFESFPELEKEIVPIIQDNQEIFASYGPRTNNPDVHYLWEKFENTLVINNEKICLLLRKNFEMFHLKNKEIIKQFLQHAKEFKLTREDNLKIRVRLFPENFLSIFGIEECDNDIENNVSALQNMIKKLMYKNAFIDLKIIPNPTLIYKLKNKEHTLHLDNGHRVRQIYFSNKFYHPQETDLSIETLQFFLKWLSKNRINFEFKDYRDLTKLTIEGRNKSDIQVKLYYSYCLSESDLQSSQIQPGWKAVNLHRWNDGPVSDAARDYANKIGIELFNQNQFFVFCYNNIKPII